MSTERFTQTELMLGDEILREFAAGRSRAAIAALLGITTTKVNTVLIREFRDRTKDREALKAQVLAQYLYVERRAYEKLEERWNPSDAKVLLASLEAKRRLFGLDDPIKVETKSVDAFSDEELLAECRRFGVPVTQLGLSKPLPALQEAVPDAEVSVVPPPPLPATSDLPCPPTTPSPPTT